MYRYTIFNEKLDEVTSVVAETCDNEGTVLVFSTGNRLELVYNLAPGYSMTQEPVE